MDRHTPLRFATSCGLLLIPAIAWNVALVDQLPPAFARAVFWYDIPSSLAAIENVARTFVFALPFFMPLEVTAPIQRRGLLLFTPGTLICFASWLALMIWQSSAWSVSAVGLMEPAYTPLLWILGVAMMGRRLFWGNGYRWWFYLPVAALFLGAHIWHTAIVYARNLPTGA